MGFWGGLLKKGKNALASSVANSSYVNMYLPERSEVGYPLDVLGVGLNEDGCLRDKFLAYNAATLLEAGSDTTTSVTQGFILFMLSHPSVLERPRAEIDLAVGAVNRSDGRMPEFEDEKKCPYLMTCIKESLHRRPSVVISKHTVPFFKKCH